MTKVYNKICLIQITEPEEPRKLITECRKAIDSYHQQSCALEFNGTVCIEQYHYSRSLKTVDNADVHISVQAVIKECCPGSNRLHHIGKQVVSKGMCKFNPGVVADIHEEIVSGWWHCRQLDISPFRLTS